MSKDKDFLLYVGDINWNKMSRDCPVLCSVAKNNASVDLVLVGNVFTKADLPEVKNYMQSSHHCIWRIV